LLRGLLAYVSTTHSFAHLSMWSLVIGLADISANDWRKRLQKANSCFSVSSPDADTVQIPPVLFDRFADTLAFAA
jgi:hypothetical protein